MWKLRNTDASSSRKLLYISGGKKQILKYTNISAPHLPPFLLGWINSLSLKFYISANSKVSV